MSRTVTRGLTDGPIRFYYSYDLKLGPSAIIAGMMLFMVVKKVRVSKPVSSKTAANNSLLAANYRLQVLEGSCK